MNTYKITKMRAGFTLTELLVTLLIILVLGGITVGIMTQSGDRVNYQKTETFIAQLENSIEQYYFDNGAYPTSSAPGGTIADAQTLFQVLGGYTSTGAIDPAAESYAEFLSPTGKNVSHAGTSWKGATPVADFAIIDPFKNYIRYHDAASAGASPPPNNPDFDLWSVGKDPSPANVADDVKNW